MFTASLVHGFARLLFMVGKVEERPPGARSQTDIDG
jgi:hypothetical protein